MMFDRTWSQLVIVHVVDRKDAVARMQPPAAWRGLAGPRSK